VQSKASSEKTRKNTLTKHHCNLTYYNLLENDRPQESLIAFDTQARTKRSPSPPWKDTRAIEELFSALF